MAQAKHMDTGLETSLQRKVIPTLQEIRPQFTDVSGIVVPSVIRWTNA